MLRWRPAAEVTNSAGATRLDLDTVTLASHFGHFEPIVISNEMFEDAVAAYQDFVEHDDRYSTSAPAPGSRRL